MMFLDIIYEPEPLFLLGEIAFLIVLLIGFLVLVTVVLYAIFQRFSQKKQTTPEEENTDQ